MNQAQPEPYRAAGAWSRPANRLARFGALKPFHGILNRCCLGCRDVLAVSFVCNCLAHFCTGLWDTPLYLKELAKKKEWLGNCRRTVASCVDACTSTCASLGTSSPRRARLISFGKQ